jgi:hypothetical protein
MKTRRCKACDGVGSVRTLKVTPAQTETRPVPAHYVTPAGFTRSTVVHEVVDTTPSKTEYVNTPCKFCDGTGRRPA